MFEKGTDEYNFMGDFFNLCKKYYKKQGTKEYWDALTSECSALSAKYGGKIFVNELLLGFINYAEKGEEKWVLEIKTKEC